MSGDLVKYLEGRVDEQARSIANLKEHLGAAEEDRNYFRRLARSRLNEINLKEHLGAVEEDRNYFRRLARSRLNEINLHVNTNLALCNALGVDFSLQAKDAIDRLQKKQADRHEFLVEYPGGHLMRITADYVGPAMIDGQIKTVVRMGHVAFTIPQPDSITKRAQQ